MEHEFGSTLSSSYHQGGVWSNGELMGSMWEKHHLLRRSPKTREKSPLNTFRDRIMCSGTNIFNNIVTVNRVMNFMVRTGDSGKEGEEGKERESGSVCA